MDTKQKYEDKLKRVQTVIKLQEPDRIPMVPHVQTFQFLRQGHTMAQILYDLDLANEDNLKYHMDFDPDLATGVSAFMAGEGPLLEQLGMKHTRWAGQPGIDMDKNSIHQFIEQEYMEEEEYESVTTDFSGWVMNRLLPQYYSALEPLQNFNIPGLCKEKPSVMARQFMNDRIFAAFETLHQVAVGYRELGKKHAEQEQRLLNAGFPLYKQLVCTTAFDAFSDCLRGTLGVLMDLMTQPEEVHKAVEQFHERNLTVLRNFLSTRPDTIVFIPLHKGFDGFMSPEQYDDFYFPTLKDMVSEILKLGATAMVYTEGKYDSRMERLADLPTGNVIIHIEEADMKRAKQILGNKFCLSGGFRSNILSNGSPEEIQYEVKTFLDEMAPGGGYLFDIDYTLDDVKEESVRAMFEAVYDY